MEVTNQKKKKKHKNGKVQYIARQISDTVLHTSAEKRDRGYLCEAAHRYLLQVFFLGIFSIHLARTPRPSLAAP